MRAGLREHILCVDDEEGILAALRQQLSARFGAECDIAVAKNAREALDLMEDLRQDGEQLAVVIADQIMPGMKGVVDYGQKLMEHFATVSDPPKHTVTREQFVFPDQSTPRSGSRGGVWTDLRLDL